MPLPLKRWNIDRAWIFGSLAQGSAGPGSDIDIAVEGLAPDNYFPALADLEAQIAFPIDLVRVEGRPSIRRRVKDEAIACHVQ